VPVWPVLSARSLAGSFASARLHAEPVLGRPAFRAFASVTVTPLFIASFFAPVPLLAFGLLFLAFVVSGTLYGPVSATLQDLVAPHARATATAFVLVAAVVVGQGLGPLLVGVLSDLLGSAESGAHGVRMAMTCAALFELPTGMLFWLLGRRIDQLHATNAPTGTD